MSILLWSGFLLLIGVFLALDLGIFFRRPHVVRVSEAVVWTTVWVILSLCFNIAVYYLYEHDVPGLTIASGSKPAGGQAALQFFTGYVVEKSLSLDNIFVIALIFSYFRVPLALQHRVLFWGVVGAVVFRGILIAAGSALLNRFEWTIYLFGAVLIVTAVKLLVSRHDNLGPETNPVVRLARRLLPIAGTYQQARFTTRVEGRFALTPLFIVLLVVESSDVMFAVDSIPAIFAVTQDPFIVFTSNVFAILGLRSLYFVLAGVIDRFRYLKISLVFLLVFIGAKMLLSEHYPIPILASLGVISAILSVGLVGSLLFSHQETSPGISSLTDPLQQVAEFSRKELRRLLLALFGATVLLIGLAMLVLPGPAILAIPAGLARLGCEFLWARQLLRTSGDRASLTAEKRRDMQGGSSPAE